MTNFMLCVCYNRKFFFSLSLVLSNVTSINIYNSNHPVPHTHLSDVETKLKKTPSQSENRKPGMLPSKKANQGSSLVSSG